MTEERTNFFESFPAGLAQQMAAIVSESTSLPITEIAVVIGLPSGAALLTMRRDTEGWQADGPPADRIARIWSMLARIELEVT